MIAEIIFLFFSSSSNQTLKQLYYNLAAEYSPSIKSQTYQFVNVLPYLDKIKNNVSKLLHNPNILDLFRSGHPQIVKYLCQNINELILISFDKKRPNMSKLALNMLLSINPDIHSALIHDETSPLPKISKELLESKEIDAFKLNRLLQIIQFSIEDCHAGNNNTFPSTFGFITDFLAIISELSVFYFFQTLCSEDNGFKTAQDWLFSKGDLPDKIIHELSKRRNEIHEIQKQNKVIESEIYNKSCEILNLLKLIKFCLQSIKLRRYFLNYVVIEVLNDDWTNLQNYDFFANDLWATIEIAYSLETSQYMRGILQRALEIINEPFSIIKPYHVSVINLLKKMMENDLHLRPYIISSHLEVSFFNLIIQFPGNTFLQNAILNFSDAAFGCAKMKEEYANFLATNLLDNYKTIDNTNNKFLLEFICQFIQKLLNASKFDRSLTKTIKSIKELDSFNKNVLKKRNKLYKNGYGGKISFFKSKSLMSLSDLD